MDRPRPASLISLELVRPHAGQIECVIIAAPAIGHTAVIVGALLFGVTGFSLLAIIGPTQKTSVRSTTES